MPGSETLPYDRGLVSAAKPDLTTRTIGGIGPRMLPQEPAIEIRALDEVEGERLAAQAGETAFATTQVADRITVLPRLVMNRDAPTLQPTTAPRYREQAVLGEGGLGEVTLATDEDIGRHVAIKRLHHNDDQAAVMRFVDEARVMGRLDHPNIVTVHDVGCDPDGRLYLVMKRLEGETLAAIIERLRDGDRETHARYPISVRLEIMTGVLRAIQFAHAQRTIHRDLKPANIMVGEFGEISVVDWGIAKRLDDPMSAALDALAPPRDEAADAAPACRPFRTRVGALLGTPAYMSPEQARGDNHLLDERSDIFSLSVVFYELVTLHHPFEQANDLPGLLEAVRNEEPRSMVDYGGWQRGGIPVELANVVHRGLEKQREDRYESVGEMLAALREVVEGTFPVTCPVTLLKSSLSLVSRLIDAYPRAVATSFVLTVLVLVASLVGAVVMTVTG